MAAERALARLVPLLRPSWGSRPLALGLPAPIPPPAGFKHQYCWNEGYSTLVS